MTKLRLNADYRLFLRRLAKSSVTSAAEEKVDVVAYKVAAPIVRKIVEAKYPPKEMAVLKKWDVAQTDDCIRLQLASGGVVMFSFRADEKMPLVPSSNSCTSRMYMADEAQTTIIQTSIDAEAAIDAVRERKLNDYNALIEHSRTLEEVEEIWPAASSLREYADRQLPILLSDDVVARIRADVAMAV